MASDIIIRPVFGRILSVMVTLIVLVSVISLVAAANLDALLRYLWPLLLFWFVVWQAFWLPRVIIGDDDVHLINVFRTITIPLDAISRVDTRFALTLFTANGRYVAWAAPAPGRHTAARTTESDAKNLPDSSYRGGTVRAGDVPRTDSGDAATVLRTRLASRVQAPHKATGETVRIRLHVVSLALVGVLLVASVLGWLL